MTVIPVMPVTMPARACRRMASPNSRNLMGVVKIGEVGEGQRRDTARDQLGRIVEADEVQREKRGGLHCGPGHVLPGDAAPACTVVT